MIGKKIGITFSTFDLLHAGHIAMLEEANKVCDYLIVGVQIDPTIDRPDTKNKPVQSLLERQIQLRACRYIDEIIVYETEQDLIRILQTVSVDVRIIGEEYKNSDFTGKSYCITNGIDIYYNSRKHKFSTSELRNRVANQTT